MVTRFFSSLALALACALLFIGCGGGAETNNSNATTANQTATTTTSTTTTSTPATTTTTTSTPASTPATTASTTGDKIGVPECDNFIEKYEACITGKVPEAARAQFNATLKQWRDSWRQAAATPQGKAGLAQGCKVAADSARQSLKAFGCDF